jgi:hypothetical protein
MINILMINWYTLKLIWGQYYTHIKIIFESHYNKKDIWPKFIKKVPQQKNFPQYQSSGHFSCKQFIDLLLMYE